jgi:tetratricopeptide (TPR) repeat protein
VALRTLARSGALLAVVGLLIGAAAGIQYVRERDYPAPPVSEETLYLTSGPAVRRMSIGYRALAADLYWIRAIQYYGGLKRKLEESPVGIDPDNPVVPDEYRLLYPLLDLTTTLDPRFNIAYRFGAIFLAEPYPGGAGRPDLAIALLEKGLQDRPDKWEYMQDIGYVYYWWLQDYQQAARWFDRAGKVRGAPWFLRSLAATTLTEGGNRESSRTMWRAIRESAEIEWLRNDADRRLTQLDVLDFIDRLQAAVDRFTEAGGEPPSNWNALVRARVLPGQPIDPTGTPYELDAKGRVQLSAKSPLHPLPNEPKRLAPPPPC